MVEINREIMYRELVKRINKIFSLPETRLVTIKHIVIPKSQEKEEIGRLAKQAVEKSYHDVVSDIDISVDVSLPSGNVITPGQYVRRIDRYGITGDSCLGLVFIPEDSMYRIILRNGMRYDLGFHFVYEDDTAGMIVMPDTEVETGHEKWPFEKVDRFWFVQIQALAKLYRNDFLISDHLANININETLEQQMVLRDIKYGTASHRYGNGEEPEYLLVSESECPYRRDNGTFNKIAAKLYAAAAVYDRLTPEFYPAYQERMHCLSDIWGCYDKYMGPACADGFREGDSPDRKLNYPDA